MKILVFTEGTIIMHNSALGHSREEIINQVKMKEESVHDFKSYIPISGAVQKIISWKDQSHIYLPVDLFHQKL